MIELTIRSASEQRILNKAIKENERRLQELQMECIIQEAFNIIKDRIENSTENVVCALLMAEDFVKIFGVERGWMLTDEQRDIIKSCLPMVQDAFAKFGYSVRFTTYSESWSRKSGKIATVQVDY